KEHRHGWLPLLPEQAEFLQCLLMVRRLVVDEKDEDRIVQIRMNLLQRLKGRARHLRGRSESRLAQSTRRRLGLLAEARQFLSGLGAIVGCPALQTGDNGPELGREVSVKCAGWGIVRTCWGVFLPRWFGLPS